MKLVHRLKTLSPPGPWVRHLGRVLVGLSIFMGLGAKCHDWCAVGLFVCVAILLATSVGYRIAWIFSPAWRSPAARSEFSPYFIGAAVWTVLIPLFWYLGSQT